MTEEMKITKTFTEYSVGHKGRNIRARVSHDDGETEFSEVQSAISQHGDMVIGTVILLEVDRCVAEQDIERVLAEQDIERAAEALA